MSKNATRFFIHKATAMASDDEAFARGNARDRVAGAGLHLRKQAKKLLLSSEFNPHAAQAFMDKAKKKVNEKGGVVPYNFQFYLEQDSTMRDAARVAGWLEDAVKHPAALSLLKVLYPHPDRGVGSPYNPGGLNPSWLFRCWVFPSLITWNEVRAVRWVAQYFPREMHCVENKKFFQKLSKISAIHRFAAMNVLSKRSYSDDSAITHRDLDWDSVAKAQRGLRAALVFVPKRHHFKMSFGEMHGIKVPASVPDTLSPFDIKAAALKALLADVYNSESFQKNAYTGELQSMGKAQFGPEMIDAVIRLVLAFGSNRAALNSWIQKSTRDEAASFAVRMHDAAQGLPMVRLNPGWARLLLQAPAQMRPVLAAIPQMQHALNGEAPASVAQALELLEAMGPLTHGLTDREIDFVQNNAQKTWEGCPDVVIRDGSYELRKLAAGDTAQLTAGRLTDCCQHLDGAGAAAAKAAWLQGDAAVYALFKGNTMVAQAMAWRDVANDLVFDSVEALGSANREVVAEMFKRAAEAIVGNLGVKRVLVPAYCHYGATPLVAELAASEVVDTPVPSFSLSYTDAGYHCRVLAQAKLEMVWSSSPAQAPQREAVSSGDVNVLMDDSGVFCEHCDAEVHPEAEICPPAGWTLLSGWRPLEALPLAQASSTPNIRITIA